MQQPFMAFENDTDGLVTGNLSIKNGLEMITIEGSLNITKDKEAEGGFETQTRCRFRY
jgi:hypothetical protein